MTAEERNTAAEDVSCSAKARFHRFEVDRSDADEIRFRLKAFFLRANGMRPVARRPE